MTGMDDFLTFEADSIEVPSGRMTALNVTGGGVGVEAHSGGVGFTKETWIEMCMCVEWDPSQRNGRRFSHTVTSPDGYPLHSEGIEADMLADLSDGRQLLRGNTRVGPGWVQYIGLEVWQDSGQPVTVRRASLEVRQLVPRRPEADSQRRPRRWW